MAAAKSWGWVEKMWSGEVGFCLRRAFLGVEVWVCLRRLGLAAVPVGLAFPCFLGGLLAKESGLTPPACRCPPPGLKAERSETRPSLAPPTFVTKDSSIPTPHYVRRR